MIIKTGIKQYMPIRSFLKLFLILSKAGDKILEVKSLNLKSNAFFFLSFFEEKNKLSKLKCLVSMNNLRCD